MKVKLKILIYLWPVEISPKATLSLLEIVALHKAVIQQRFSTAYSIGKGEF